MSDTDNTQTTGADNQGDEDAAPNPPTELQLLRDRCKLMGITYSNNAGVEALRKKIEDKLNAETPAGDTSGDDDGDDDQQNETAGDDAQTQSADIVSTNDLAPQVAAERPLSKREQIQATRDQLISEQMRLVRVRITNLDPKKKDLPGEIVTVGNEFIGTVRKYVPFGELTDGGYHIPYCIYTQLEERKFLSISVKKDREGREQISHRPAKEFAIEVLPQLTPEELARLAAAQSASGLIEPGLEG